METSTSPTANESYDVFGYDLPKLTDDGEAVAPSSPASFVRFTSLEAAEAHVRAIASKFERVQLLRVSKSGDQVEAALVARVVDGSEQRAADLVRH